MKQLIYKSFIVAHLLIFCIEKTDAQVLDVGIKSGVIKSKLSGRPGNLPRSNFYIGLIANKKVGQFHSIQTEINYSSKGSKAEASEVIPVSLNKPLNLPANKQHVASYKRETILNYIEIPLLLRSDIPLSKYISYHLLVGPYFGLLARSTDNVSSVTINSFDDAGQTPVASDDRAITALTDYITGEQNFKKSIIGAEAGMGFSYRLKKIKIFTEGRLSTNLTNVGKNLSATPDNSQDSKTFSAGILYEIQ